MTSNKINEAAQAFSDLFHASPAFTVRSPGRVNLLGEHTDYNGLPVLPTAVDRFIAMPVRPRRDRTVHAVSLDYGGESAAFELEESIPKHPQGHWANYIKAGMQGVLSKLSDRNLSGCDLLFTGTIPNGAGLSSSSALVVASALALLKANEIPFDRTQLAEWMAEAEWYVGTRGGGMDQAACLLAEEGNLLKIDFFPLRITPVSWNDEYAIVICNSGVFAKKSEGALNAYNYRAAECRFAKLLLDKHLGRSNPNVSFQRLGDLLHSPFNFSYEDLSNLIESALNESYTFSELVEGIGDENQVADILRDCSLDCETSYEGLTFCCGKRYRHIVSDGARVERSCDCLLKGDVRQFGKLMQAGHVSAKNDFEISCHELDELVDLAQHNGAIGARLTGAGFGGCAVSVVPTREVESFVGAVELEYYSKNNREVDGSIIVTRPCDGAGFIETR